MCFALVLQNLFKAILRNSENNFSSINHLIMISSDILSYTYKFQNIQQN
jgi:hypothetical protein